MVEEFELYNPDPESDTVLVVYRGEESYGLPYMDLRESDAVEVEHQGQPWGGFEERNQGYYDEPIYEEPPEESDQEEDNQGEDQQEDGVGPEEPGAYDLLDDMDTSAMFRGGIVAGMITVYLLLFVLGPYVLI